MVDYMRNTASNVPLPANLRTQFNCLITCNFKPWINWSLSLYRDHLLGENVAIPAGDDRPRSALYEEHPKMKKPNPRSLTAGEGTSGGDVEISIIVKPR
jgi:hypothetical protein